MFASIDDRPPLPGASHPRARATRIAAAVAARNELTREMTYTAIAAEPKLTAEAYAASRARQFTSVGPHVSSVCAVAYDVAVDEQEPELVNTPEEPQHVAEVSPKHVVRVPKTLPPPSDSVNGRV